MAALTTLSNVKAWLKISSPIDDTLLTTLIAGASALIESWVSRTFAQTTYTERLDGQGGDSLLLGNYPVISVSTLLVDNALVTPSPDCNTSGYSFDSLGVSLVGGQRFRKAKGNITIVYSAGFTSIPFDVAQVCMELVGKKYRERDRIGQNSKTLAGEIVSFSASDLSDEVKSMLNNYRKVVPI